MTTRNYLLGGLILVLAMAGSFFLGIKVGRVSINRGMMANRNMMGRQMPYGFNRGNINWGNRMPMMGKRTGITGQITNIANNQITLRLTNGNTQIISLSPTTSFSKTTQTIQGDLKVGSNITVFSGPNSSGTVSATAVQINL